MNRKLSFDLDGVVADFGEPFYGLFEQRYGVRPTSETFNHLLYNGLPWNSIQPDEFAGFNNDYFRHLYNGGFGDLELVESAVNGLRTLVGRGYEDITINTYRPGEFEDITLDTTRFTRLWLNDKGLDFVKLEVAQNEAEKVAKISEGGYFSHVDDQSKILSLVFESNGGIRRGLHVQPFSGHLIEGAFDDFRILNNWDEIVLFCMGQEDGR